MKIHNGYLYYSSNLIVYRQKLKDGQLVPDSRVDTIVIDNGPGHSHQTKPLAFDGKGYMYVGWGAGSDVCTNGRPGSMGAGKPDAVIPGEECPQLIDHGGIWKFDENKLNQKQEQGLRYATGMRSIVGMDWDKSSNSLYAVVHGRDNFRMLWPGLYSPWESAVLPSEELFKVHKGIDGGWPYYYYDHMRGKKYLNPEYGGDKFKEGDGGRFPPLDESEWVNGDKTRLINIVLHGLSDPITVKGLPYSETMPAHGSFLNNDQVAEVLTYIRKSFGNNSDAISKEEVAALRK